MLICDRCGKVKDECDLRTVVEEHGESHLDYNCRCGGEYLEATECKICGKFFIDETEREICDSCIDGYTTVGNALDYGEQHKTTVENINGAIAYLLGEKQINEILTKWVEENFTDRSAFIQDYCKQDIACFVDFINEREDF